jgi:hypothetical protein
VLGGGTRPVDAKYLPANVLFSDNSTTDIHGCPEIRVELLLPWTLIGTKVMAENIILLSTLDPL